MNHLFVAALLGVAALGTGGLFLMEKVLEPDCEGAPEPGLPMDAPGQTIRLTISSQLAEEPVRVCMYAADSTKLYDQTLDAHAETALYWDIRVAAPVEVWIIDRPWPEGTHLDGVAEFSGQAQCGDRRPEFLYEDHPGDGSLIAVQCEGDGNHMPPRVAAESSTQSTVPIPDQDRFDGLGPLAMAAGLGALLAVVVKFRTAIHWAFVGLFSRIQAPRVLDQAVRADIHHLVMQEPGIRPVEVARRLELAAGQTTHHLRVMVRANTLSMVRQGLAIHYFAHGAYSPNRMRQLAALRTTSISRLHNALLQRPGAPLSALANLGGLSRPRASRLARRLQRLGLARAERHGRQLHLWPLS